MPYLVAARRGGRMGVIPMMANGAAATKSDLLRARFPFLPIGPPVRLPGPMPVFNPNPTAGGSCTAGSSATPGWQCVNGKWTAVGDVNPPPQGPNIVIVGPQTSTPNTSTANAGTPVPTGYPTSQIFVDSNGGFWEFSASQNQWMNVGTPYNTGAGGVPPAAPTGSTPSAPTSLTSPTTAPAPVSVSVATPSSTYSDILTWLQGSDLGSTIGFPSIPNWIIVAGAAALAWKFSHGSSGSKRNPARLRAHRRGRR